ncbi:MAG: HYExAFE family protein [Planctomycetaceae bacterium]|nr:HYExAFE family protein [Planctomycetaceae bacterium]
MDRTNHYELAFEAFLRSRQTAYVAVDEARRTLIADRSVKSLDFIVTSKQGLTWLVDVKGRHFPSGLGRQYWKNWSTRDDLLSLAQWERLFGEQFRGLFVFAYEVCGTRSPLEAEALFSFRDKSYGFLAIRLEQYACFARTISPRWDTVAVSARRFRELAEPFESLL